MADDEKTQSTTGQDTQAEPKRDGKVSKVEKDLSVEVLAALQPVREQTVDANPLVQSITRQARQPEDILALTERALALVQRTEQERLQNYATYIQTVIAAKRQDPDEVDRRDNNRFRRGQKALVSFCGAVSLIAGGVCATTSGSFVLTSAFLSVGVLLLVITAITSSGSELSAGDVVRIMSAIGRMWPGADQPGDAPGKPKRRK